MKNDKTIEEYQHQEQKRLTIKNTIIFLSVLIVLPICLYLYYQSQISRERSIYGKGVVISVTDISSRGKSMFICKVNLESGEQIDAVCNSDAYWLGSKKVTIEKTQTAGELFMYEIRDTLLDDLTQPSPTR